MVSFAVFALVLAIRSQYYDIRYDIQSRRHNQVDDANAPVVSLRSLLLHTCKSIQSRRHNQVDDANAPVVSLRGLLLHTCKSIQSCRHNQEDDDTNNSASLNKRSESSDIQSRPHNKGDAYTSFALRVSLNQ